MIGRSEKADISLLEPTISRRHASIQIEGDRARIVDLGSKHGTYVNSRRATSADLRVGDIVVLGLSLVLRLGQSDTPIPVTQTPLIPVESPTLVDPLDALTSTALRDVPRRPTGIQPHAARRSTPDESAPVLDLTSICSSLLPEAHVRLSELRLGLRRMVDDGVDETDPYPILASVESVLATMNRIMQAVSGEEISAAIVELRPLVRRVVDRVAPSFEAQRIRLMADVDPSYRVQCDASRLEGALALLLRCAGRSSPDGNPVEIVATVEQQTLRLMVSHLGREYPDDVLARSRERNVSDPLLRDFGEVQHLMRVIGGTITVETRPGIGSTVRLLLPVPKLVSPP